MSKYSKEIKKNFRKFLRDRPKDFTTEDDSEVNKEWDKWRKISIYQNFGNPNSKVLCIVPETLEELARHNINYWQRIIKDSKIEAKQILQEYKRSKRFLESHWDDPNKTSLKDQVAANKKAWVEISDKIRYCKVMRKAAFLLYNRNF